MRTLADFWSFLEGHFGKAWLSDPANAGHPLCRGWLDFHAGHGAWALHRSEQAPRALAFAHTLHGLACFPTRTRDGLIRDDDSFQRDLLRRARLSVAEFDAAEFEATVAAAYRDTLRLPIVAIERGGRPTPDFEIAVPGSFAFFAECKARTTAPPEHVRIQAVRGEICSRLWPTILGSPHNYGILVATNQLPNRADIKPLVQGVRDQVSSGRPFEVQVGTMGAQGQIFFDADRARMSPHREPFGPWPHIPEPVRGFLVSAGVLDARGYTHTVHDADIRELDGHLIYSRPRTVVVRLAIVPDHSRATAALVRVARRRQQLPASSPGVVMVRAPDFYTPIQFRDLRQGVRSALSGSSRISAAVMWHLTVARVGEGTKELGWVPRWQLVLMVNRNAAHPLPPWFSERCLPRSAQYEVIDAESWRT